MQIYAIASELWAINEIQNGDRRHLEFITYANFGYMAHFL